MHRRLRIVFANRNHVPVLLLKLDPARQEGIQLALRSLHQHRISLNIDRNSLGNLDRLFSNS